MPEGSYRFVPSVDRLGAGQKQALMDLAKPAPQPPARPARPRRADPVVPAAAAQALPAVVLAAPVPDADLQAPALPWAPESSITAAAWAEQVRVGKRENGWRKNPWQPSLAPVAAGQKVAPADLPEDFMPEAAPAPRGRRAPIGLHGATAAETGSLKSMREEARRKHLEEERRARMERRQKQEAERRASKAKPSAPAQPDQPVLMADVFAMYGEPEAATPSTLPQAEPSSHMADVFSMYGL
jgi:hypothetical protein